MMNNKKVPEIRLKGFQGEWKEKRIGNVANVVGGGTPSTFNDSYWNGTIPWFTPSEVGKQKYVSCSERNITKDGIDNSSTKLLPASSLLLSSRATIGEVSINTIECCTNQGFQSLIPKEINLEFLYSLIHTKKKELIRESSGSTFLEISANKIKNIKIDIPSNDEQQSIGEYFSNLDALISSATSRLESLKQVKAASLQAMFPQEGETTPKVRFKGFEGEWKNTTVGKCGSWSKGSLLSKDDISPKGKYSCIHYGELFTVYGEVIFDILSKTDMENGYMSQIGDILFPDSDVTPTGLARCSAIMKENVILGGGINIFRPFAVNYPPFVSYAINNEKKQIISRVTGTTVRHINARALSEVKILLPNSIKEQKMIASYFINLDKQISLQSQRLEKLKQIKAACLDKMFV